MPRPVRVKICCIADAEEARQAIALGASAVGLVSAMPSGPGVVDEATITAVARTLPPAVGSFLLTSLTDPEAIVDQQRRLGCNTLQLVDRLPAGSHRRLRAALPGIALVQVIHVTGEAAVEEALAIAPEVDALLLDSGNPTAPVRELGGTGRVHDWTLSRRIRERSPVPVFLAGGLNPDNVAAAIAAVEPFGVDVCSGLRSPPPAGSGDGWRLDRDRLGAFFAAVAAASAELPATPSAPTGER